MDKQQIIDYIRHTPNNSNVNVVKGMLNSEGGGSSDFSTAEVTIVNASQDTLDIFFLPMLIEDGEEAAVVGSDTEQLSQQASMSRTVPLYKGKCFWITYFYEPYINYTFTGSENVTVNEFGVVITGDCTITIS